MLIEIEGIDGVGKTTQCRLLKIWLETMGNNVSIVKDLESTALGRSVRGILTSNNSHSREVELFSFLACKANLHRQVITPKLEAGNWVICDRGIGSFISYFEAHGFGRDFLNEMLESAIVCKPQSTLYIDCTPHLAQKRIIAKNQNTKFDQMGLKFFEKQRDIFIRLSESEDGWSIVDGSKAIEEVHQLIVDKVGEID